MSRATLFLKRVMRIAFLLVFVFGVRVSHASPYISGTDEDLGGKTVHYCTSTLISAKSSQYISVGTTYQWEVYVLKIVGYETSNTSKIPIYRNVWESIVGETESSFMLKTAGTYRCKITKYLNPSTYTGTVVVSFGFPKISSITIPSESCSQDVTLKYNGTLDGITNIDWKRKSVNAGAVWESIPGEGNTMSPLFKIADINGYTIQVSVTNSCGTSLKSTSTATAVTILKQESITLQETTKNACVGEPTKIIATLSNQNVSFVYEYQWSFSSDNGVSWVVISNSSGGVYSGYTGNELTITPADQSLDKRLYQCKVFGKCVSPVSNSCTLRVKNPPVLTSITPSSILMCKGRAVTVQASATGDAVTYSWVAGGVEQVSTTQSLTYNMPNTDNTSIFFEVTARSEFCSSSQVMNTTVQTFLPLSVSVKEREKDCSGTSKVLSAIVEGGNAPYSYLWNTFETLQEISVSMSGSYSVSVNDACDNSVSRNYMTQTSVPFNATAEFKNVTCHGDKNGSITVSCTGGTSPYFLSSVNINANEKKEVSPLAPISMNNLSAGVYTLVISDQCKADTTIEISISEPDTLVSVITKYTNARCTNKADGTATVAVWGGVQPYKYIWDNGQHTQHVIGLMAGTYLVNVVDQNACLSVSRVTISEPSRFSAQIFSGDVGCRGDSTGTLSVVHSGGTLPYTYQWSSGDTLPELKKLVAGNYKVTVSDACDAVEVLSAEISEPDKFQHSQQVSSLTCNGLNDGMASIDLGGGVKPYHIQWSNSSTENRISSLAPGTYYVTATDACTDTVVDTVVVFEPAELKVVIQAKNVRCSGGTDGVGVAEVSGGTLPYTYLWSNGQKSQEAVSLFADNYIVNVVDANGCVASAQTTIDQPQQLVASVTVVNARCPGMGQGSVEVLASGGTEPYAYRWSNDEHNDSSSARLLPAGSYTVTIVDACHDSVVLVNNILEPHPLVASVVVASNVSCNGGSDGSIAVSASGGVLPYVYHWSNSHRGAVASKLVANTYEIHVIDACEDSVTLSQTLTQPAPLTLVVDVTKPLLCISTSDAELVAHVEGGTLPYKYNWSNGLRDSVATGLSWGMYTLNVVDARGCSVIKNQGLKQPIVLSAHVSDVKHSDCYGAALGSVSVTATGGNAPYRYSWSNGAVTRSSGLVNAGTYTVTVSDQCNDSVVLKQVVKERESMDISVSKTDVACFDEKSGAASVITRGGKLPYSFTWTGRTGTYVTPVIEKLDTGSYHLTVTDACQQTLTANVIINQPDLLGARISHRDLSCYNTTTGSAAVYPSGGTPPYSFSWSNGLKTDSVSRLLPGNYIVQVIDSKGCSLYQAATIKNQDRLSASVFSGSLQCHGGVGEASVSVSGGSGQFSFMWSDGQKGQRISNIVAGQYQVTVTDDDCDDSLVLNTELTQPGLLSLDGESKNVTCAGKTDGRASITVRGGAVPYTIKWSTGDTTSFVGRLVAGTYSVTVTDNCLQKSSMDIIIEQPDSLVLTSFDKQDVSCYGFIDGKATARVKGGTLPYTYVWAHGQQSATADNLFPGLHSLYVLDAQGCVTSGSVAISQPPSLAIDTAQVINNTCFGGNSGMISVVANGGNLPYSYSWSNGSTTAKQKDLSAGLYSVIITDACKAMIEKTVRVTEPLKPSLDIVTTDVRCYGAANGKATAVVRNAREPYAIEWSNKSREQSLPLLGPGTYVVTCTDACGIILVDTAIILQPERITVDVEHEDVSCAGRSDGKAWVNRLKGGRHPYTVNWSNNLAGDTLFNIIRGKYTVFVNDASGCQAQNSVEIVQPMSFVADVVTTQVSCNNKNDGAASVVVYGGKIPYTYIWTVKDSTRGTLTGLAANDYRVTASDACGDSKTLPFSITQPAAMNVEVTTTTVRCNGEHNASIRLNISGGNPAYAIAWSSGSNHNNHNLENLAAGTYSFSVTDACMAKFSDVITFDDPTPVVVAAVKSDAHCHNSADGWAKLSASGGSAPYTYMWDFGVKSDSISRLFPNLYAYSVHDSRGCATSGIVTIGKPEPLSLKLHPVQTVCRVDTGKVATTVLGGTPPYAYRWSNKATTSLLTKVAPGTYSVVVTDTFGCTASGTAVVPVFVKQYPLCMVTVDSSSKSNKIIWEKDGDTTISGWNIYCMFGQYRKIGFKSARDQYSEFNDVMAKPRQTSYQYAISTVDKCGNESPLSYSHSTMLMWSDYSTEPNKANVEWTPYVDESGDFRPEKYLIYKGRAMNSMKLVDSVPGTSTVYIDEHNDGATYYRVTFSKKNQCVVTGKLKSDGGPYSQSLSNLAESKLLDSRYLDELSLVLDLSPVPARDVAVVVVKNKKNVVFDLSIIDMVGNETLVAKQIKQDTYSQAIDVSTYSPGQYVIQLKAKNQVLTHKLVITR